MPRQCFMCGCRTDSPSGSCTSWFLSTDSNCRAGAQDRHLCLLHGLERRGPALLASWLVMVLSIHRDRCVILLFPSHRFLRFWFGPRSVREFRMLWDRSSSVTVAWMCPGAVERPEEEQFNRRPLWHRQGTGQEGRAGEHWSPWETRSSTAAKNGHCDTAIINSPRSTDRAKWSRVKQNVSHKRCSETN